MKIGVPKEIKPQENRIGLTPDSVKTLVSEGHEVLVEKYITMTQEFVKDVANESRLANYKDIFEVIINYHNTYGDHKTNNNWHDWLMILPINL